MIGVELSHSQRFQQYIPSSVKVGIVCTLAESFFGLFPGLKAAHGLFIIDNEKGGGSKVEGKAYKVDGPVTVEMWDEHLNGITGLGIFPLQGDNTSRWGAIDLDDHYIDHRALAKQSADLGLPLIVCRSKSGGAHLYIFLSEPVESRLLRMKLTAMVHSLGLSDGLRPTDTNKSSIEIFPKHDALSEVTPFGNWINMPYFAGKRSVRYAVFCNGSVTPEEFIEIAYKQRLTAQQLIEYEPPAPSVSEPESQRKEEKPPFMVPDEIPEGTRNDTLFRIACSLFAKGLGENAVWSALLEENRDKVDPPLPENELRQAFKSATKYAQREKESKSNPDNAIERFPTSLIMSAEDFVNADIPRREPIIEGVLYTKS